MTREELVKELLSMARQSDDSAVVNEAGAEAHGQEYEDLCSAPDEVNHERMLELYAYRVEWSRQAKRLRKEAEILRQAARLLD